MMKFCLSPLASSLVHGLRTAHRTRSLLLALPLLAACATGGYPKLTPERPVSLAEAMAIAEKADFDDYFLRPRTRVKDVAAFAEMKAHIKFLYNGVTATHFFLGHDNQFVDCIPIEQQPGLRNTRGERAPYLPLTSAPKASLALIPDDGRDNAEKAPAGPARRTLDLTLKAGTRDRFGGEMFCADKTIPMRRVTLEEMVRFRTLGAFLAKAPFGGPLEPDGEGANGGQITPGGDDHYYGRGVQFVDNFGGDSWMNVWSPAVAAHEMSLSQIWVVGTDGPRQTVEAGWQVYPDKWSSGNAALFIYWSTDNYANGCYNLECSGFVQLASNIYLGSGFDHYSERDGGQWGFNLQYKRGPDGTWWLFYRGPGDYITVGYYPQSLFQGGALSRRANKIAWGGEDSGSPSAFQMGSGAFPSEGFGRAAYLDTVFYIDTNVVSQWPTLGVEEVPTTCYKANISNFSDNRQKTFLYFGGPNCN